MKKTNLIFTIILGLALSVQNLYAAAPSWNIDKGHSNFYFSVSHIYSKIHGRFGDFSGTFNFDPKNLAESSISFSIKVKSIDTNIGKRDKHLLSVDFFDESKFPTMTFTSTAISQTGPHSFDVAGKFTVKGTAYDLVLPLTLAGIKDHPMEKGMLVAGFNGKVTLDRLAYKIGAGKFYEFGVVGKDVDVLVSLEVLRKK